MTAQRVRLLYRKGPRLKFLSHLDVLRAMERAVRRAGLPLAYSEGFTPHPKLAFASPLPLGFEGEAEVVDVTLTERGDIKRVLEGIAAHSSEDLQPFSAHEVPLYAPAPQATIKWADYRVDLPEVAVDAAGEKVYEFLQAETFPWSETRQGKERRYDLRALVLSIDSCAVPGETGARLAMRLAARNEASARPEQVVSAIFPGAQSQGHTRVAIILDEPSPARRAWRLAGRYL